MWKAGEPMRSRNSLGFFFLVGVVGLLILGALQQLVGSICFQKAAGTGEGGRIALEAMQSTLNVQPSHSFSWFVIGRRLQDLSTGAGVTLITRRYLLEEAKKYLEEAAFLRPTASLYHYHLGRVYAALSPYHPLLKPRVHMAFCRTVSLNPTNIQFRRAVASYYLNQYGLLSKRVGGSESDIEMTRENFQHNFRALLEMQPPHEVNRILDHCFAVTQRYEDLREIIPDRPEYRFHLAQFLMEKGLWTSARKEFEIAIAQDPTNPETYHAYGSALFAHNQYQEALAVWKKAQATSPQDPRSYLSVSNAFWTLKRKDEAIAELEQLVSIHPDQTSYRLLLARRLEGAGNPREALRVYREALEKHPNKARIYAQMADYWVRQGNFSEAEASFQQAISLSTSTLGYRNQLARIYFRQKRYARAIDEWQNVLKQNPKDISALMGIARSYEELEAWSGALRYYKQVLAIRPDDRSLLQRIERIERKTAQ